MDFLIIGGLFEFVWAFFIKKSVGFTVLVTSAVTIITMIASFALLSLAMRTLPLGTDDTVWTGKRAVGAFAFSIMVLGKTVSPMRLAAAAQILTGIVLMKLSSTRG